MGSTRSAQQAHRDAINIQRMLSRLEAATEKQQHEPSTSYTTTKDYYKTLSTLSSIKNAKKLLDESVTDSTARSDLANRLGKLQSHYQTILQNTPRPHHLNPRPDLEHLRPVLPIASEVELISSPSNERSDSIIPDLPTPEAQAASNLLSLGEDEADLSGVMQPRRQSSIDGVSDAITSLSSTRSPDSTGTRPSYNARTSSRSYGKSDTPATTQSLSNLLSHHRSEQESLTEELATMASRLKMNSLEFSQLLEKDKGLLENAENQLDGNLSGMIKERDRLKAYKKTGGVTTWFVIGSVLAVLFAWLFMFALMRVF